MARRSSVLLLEDMLECIEAIKGFISQLSLEEVLNSRLHKDAIIRNLEVLGEAANQLPSYVHEQAPSIPWRQMIGLRNRLIHEYHGVNWDILIPTILEELPTLQQELSNLLHRTQEN
jgi:uncharacterized protein with HEPN domain